jgi:hypothetical protein
MVRYKILITFSYKWIQLHLDLDPYASTVPVLNPDPHIMDADVTHLVLSAIDGRPNPPNQAFFMTSCNRAT